MGLQVFPMRPCTQGYNEGALSHSEGMKDEVNKALGLYNVPISLNKMKAHYSMLKGRMVRLCAFVMHSCTQGKEATL